MLSERRMTHSASLRATGSAILAWAALASASLPLRAASITRFTAATSFAEVVALGATANGPEAGRTSGLNSARLSNSAPCKPTLAWAKAVQPAAVGLRPRLRQRRCLPHGCERLLGRRRSGSRARQGHFLRGRPTRRPRIARRLQSLPKISPSGCGQSRPLNPALVLRSVRLSAETANRSAH